MPKNKFNSFYYGIGMKLDEASVDKAGQQLEGRLNQVVDQITQKVATMSNAIAKGAKDIDAKELVKSLVEAQQELNQFQNFDPSKLQKQIDALNATVTSLSNNLGEVGTQLKTFTDDVTSRLSNIEIKTSKQGKDSLKSDLKGMIELARGYRDVMAQGVDIDTSALDKYFVKVKQGFKSLQNSGNPMEMFSDKELAQYFVSFTKILQEMGAPVDKLREEFYSLSSAFKTAFEKSGSIGSNSVFKDIGYQIETVNVKLKQSQSKLASYKNQIQDLNRRRKSTGFDVTVESDKNLSFDQKIDKINEYDNVILESTQGSQEWYEATKKQIALIQAAEKELAQLSKGSNSAQYMKKWNDAFGVDFDLNNKFSQNVLSGYVEQAQKDLIKLGKIYSQAFLEVKSNNARLSELMAKDAAASSSKKTRQTVTSTQKQKADGVVAEIDAKIKINQEEWRKAINAAMTQVEPKVKPFKIKVEATSGNILKEVRKIRDASLVNQGKDGTSDVNAFNKRFDKFYKNLQKRREEIIAELKNNWHPALKDAFSFKFELLGIDKKSLTKNIDTYFVSMVDVINDALEQKPIEFHSNIDTLIEEIKSKVENLEIKSNVNLGAGNVGVSSNAGQIVYVLGGGIQGGASITQPNIPPTPPSEPPAPTASTQTNNKKQPKKTSKKEIETAEDHAKTAYEAGKDIIEYYIRLAEFGKNLNSIREIADKPITADMFDDESLTKWVRGKIYTKDDIGKAVAPGRKLTPQALNKFLTTMGITEADLAEANTQEETEFLVPLKKYIYRFMQNRQVLNELLQQLVQSQSGKNIVEGYNAANSNKEEYLAGNLTSTLKSLMPATPKTKAQHHVADIFKKYNIDLSELPSAQSYAEQWHIIQSQLIGKEGLDFNNLMTDLGQLKGNVGKIYENFMTLLKVSQAYMATSNSLSEVGKEAKLLISGRTELKNKRIKKYNPNTGFWDPIKEWEKNPDTELWDQVGWTKAPKIVEQGIRGILKNLQVIFENEAGRTLLGYNLGKGYIPDDVFQSANGSYIQIIKVLTTALENSAQILFGRNMKGLEGNTSVGRYVPPTTHQTNEPYQFTTQHTEKEQISKWISEINSQKARLQAELSEINKQYSKLVKPEDKLRVAQLVAEIKTKQESFNQYNEKIIVERNKIDELKNSLTNPEVVYEDVVEKLLQAEENLIRLKKELATKKRNQKSGTYSKEIEDLQAKITAQENSIKSMTGSSKVASRSNSEEKANHIIAQEEEKLRKLNEELNTQRANLDIKKKQEEINRLKNEQAPLTKKVIALRNEVQQIQNTINNSDSKKATAEQSATIQSKNQEIDNIVQKTTALQQQIDTLQSEIGPHIIEKSFLLKEIEFRKKYVNALKEALKKRKKVRTQEEISSDIDSRTNELNKLQDEQSKLENDLQTLKTKLGKFGSLQEVSSVLQKLQSIEKDIARLDSQLSKHQKNLKNADNKKHIYSKTYYQAVNDLPRVQAEKETVRADLISLTNQYTSERTAVVTEALAQKKLGILSDNDAKKIQENLYNIIDLNKKLQDGTLTQEEYTQKVTDAYIFMRKATTEEAKATAKADAEKLANAVLLVKKYQEEETILERIIRTQKPKEPSNTQPFGQNNGNTSNKSKEPTQPVTGNTPIVTGTLGSGTVNGGIVLNASGSGLATEDTVSKIYALLSIKRNSTDDSYNSRIDAIKKAIVAKEAEERASLETARKKATEEKKGTDEVKKKSSEERKGTEEVKKKTSEEKNGTEAVKKKVAEEKKVIEPTKTENNVAKNNSNQSKNDPQIKIATNDILQSVGKTKQELWIAIRKTQQSIESGNVLFREHSFSLKNGKVIDVTQGSYALTPPSIKSKLDTHGHIHPRNSLFSALDLENISKMRNKNASYDVESLITPNFTYTLSGLSKVAPDALNNLIDAFKLIESIYIPPDIVKTAKESALYYFAKNNGVDYSRQSINTNGTLSNITEQTERFSQEILDKFLKHIQTRVEFRSTKKDDPKYDALSTLVRDQLKELKQDNVYNKLNRNILIDQTEFNMFKDATMLQNAIGRNWDLTLFYDNLVELLKSIEESGQQIPPESTLGKIKQAVTDVINLTSDPIEQAKVMNKIKPELVSYIGYNPKIPIDNRDVLEKEWQRIIALDKSGQIRKDLKQYKAFDNSKKKDEMQADTYNDNDANLKFVDDLANKTIEELKAELSRLEGLRDTEQVDPRFATAEKQDTIIELLRNGVKVIGGGKVSGDTDKQGGTKTPKIPSTVRADEKIQAIDKLSNVNKNSLLYKQYNSAKSNLESALSEAQSKGKDLTLQDTNKIKALINEVTKLGNKIINASNAFEQFKNSGGEAIDYTNKKVTSLEDEMLELAYKNASESNMLLSNVSYDKATQKMTYNLTDLEGTVTKVTMAYQDLFGIISKTSDKTTNSASKIYNTIEGEMTKRISVNDLIKNEQNLEKSKEYQAYLSAYDAMMVAQNNLREKGELATKSEKDELISLTKQVGNARTEFEQLADASEKFKAKIKNHVLYSLDEISPTFDIENQDAVEKALKDFALSQDGLTEKQKKMILETWNFKNAQDGATYSVIKGKDQIVSMSVEMDKGSRTIGRYAVETKKYMSGFDKFMSSLKGKWQEVARYLMTFGSMYRVFAELQKGVQYVRAIDSALTELKKVTNETEETYNRFLDTASKTASKVGSTIKEVVSSTADWGRLGYSLEDAANLAESTSVLLNVSEFQSIDEATSALVSTMQAFGYAAKDSMHVVDVMNEIGKFIACR